MVPVYMIYIFLYLIKYLKVPYLMSMTYSPGLYVSHSCADSLGDRSSGSVCQLLDTLKKAERERLQLRHTHIKLSSLLRVFCRTLNYFHNYF